MAQHDVNDAVRLWTVFRDLAGDQAAPTTVTLTVRHPDGEVEVIANSSATAGDLTIAGAAMPDQTLEDETGVYKADVVPDEAGFWFYKWAGTGAVVEQEQGWFEVRRDETGDPAP